MLKTLSNCSHCFPTFYKPKKKKNPVLIANDMQLCMTLFRES